MSFLKKLVIGVSGALCFAFFVLFQISKAVEAGQASPEVVYPSGNLSDNLFVAQNSVYSQNEALPVSYSFSSVPYTMDLPNGNTANVDTGHIVQASDNMVVYVSQMDGDYDPHSVVLSQYPKVVYINYSQQDSFSMTLREEYGFFNGLPTTYFMDHLIVSTGSGTETKNAYVLAYCFQPETATNVKMLVSVATTENSNEAFEQCKAVLDAVAYTVRYDEKLDASQTKAREDKIKAAEKAAAEQEKKLKAEQEEAEKTVQTVEEESSSDSYQETSLTSDIGSNFTVPVSVTKDFVNLSILVSWTNEYEDASLYFNGPYGTVYPDLITSKQATLSVGECAPGEYSLTVNNYASLGELNTKLIENGR